ncbi:hypothetical protein BPUTSESOX_1535 [uncultured Gammaproteobacteria bacterium]|nr:hypothetical protein [uncultured Gammaproteobacteria bacterium]VVH51564.1 hypothetical protein BPUTSESOX_1535 [uncultured Gammaproteobacteria bacterium]
MVTLRQNYQQMLLCYTFSKWAGRMISPLLGAYRYFSIFLALADIRI